MMLSSASVSAAGLNPIGQPVTLSFLHGSETFMNNLNLIGQPVTL